MGPRPAPGFRIRTIDGPRGLFQKRGQQNRVPCCGLPGVSGRAPPLWEGPQRRSAPRGSSPRLSLCRVSRLPGHEPGLGPAGSALPAAVPLASRAPGSGGVPWGCLWAPQLRVPPLQCPVVWGRVSVTLTASPGPGHLRAGAGVRVVPPVRAWPVPAPPAGAPEGPEPGVLERARSCAGKDVNSRPQDFRASSYAAPLPPQAGLGGGATAVPDCPAVPGAICMGA